MGRLIKGPWAFGATDDQDLMPPSDDLEYVAFDVETTGFNKNDRIVEIALVTFKNGELLEEWSTLLNPQRDVGKSNIHGITASMVSTAPLFEEVVNDIFRIINGRVLAAAGKASSLKKTTIICIKGKLIKKVSAVKPKCPKGYKLK